MKNLPNSASKSIYQTIFQGNVIKSLLIVFCITFFFSTSSVAQCGPPQLSASTGPDFQEITLSWSGVPETTSYKIYGSKDGGAT